MPAAFPHAVTHLDLQQTHISWVVLTGHFAYKIKKSVRYDFFDGSTLELRRALCEEELRLNRRFAPDLYVDVVPVTDDEGQTHEEGQLKIGGRGSIVEYAVRMHEFDPAQELARQLELEAVTPHDMNTFAARLSDLHRQAAVAAADSPHGAYARVRQQMLDNFIPLRTHLTGAQDRQTLERLAQWTQESLARLKPVIDSRKRDGWVRECHGDLHARNIVRWRQQWMPFDCLEFDPDLRWIDVMSDVAFLFMDLTARGHEGLAYEFLSRYLEETGDYAGLRLLPLYSTYRALVRAMVDALGAETAGSEAALALNARLAERMKTAVRFMDARRPTLAIMHGVTACGKSWMSERLICTLNAVRIRSDLERKRLAGIAPLARRHLGVGKGHYTAASTEHTYARLLECAEAAIDGGCTVIVDATFLNASHRQLFRDLALRRGCPFVIVSCGTDLSTLLARLQTRAHNPLDPSEGNQAVLEEQMRTQHVLTAEEQSCAVHVDTSWLTSADAGIQSVKARLAQATE